MTRGQLLLLFATLAAFFLLAVAVFVAPPPVWVPVAMGGAYVGVLLFGVLYLPAQMFGPALCEVKGAPNLVALTFDDGPDPRTTPLVLEALSKAGARATFFLIGKKVDLFPELVRRIREEGHELGVHSYDHSRLYAFLTPREVEADIERTRDAIFRAAGVRPVWFRPPVGQMSPRTAEGVKRAQAETVGFSVRALDGLKGQEVDQCLRRLRPGLVPGAIVLLHDAPEQEPPLLSAEPFLQAELSRTEVPKGVELVPALLTALKERGLVSVTLPELILAGQAS